MMNYQLMIQQANDYLNSFYATHVDERIAYHNETHTKFVVESATQIANHYQLNDHDFFVVYTAAQFHDLGYFISGAKGHEEAGAVLVGDFLLKNGADEETITAVKNCILATKIPQQPHNLLEEIVCDADAFHLGTDIFSERNKLLRKEVEMLTGSVFDKNNWRRDTISFLETHQYHTEYAKLLLNTTKAANLDKLKQKDGAKKQEQSEEKIKQKNTALKEEKKTKDNIKPSRGIETIFRVSSSNHQNLSNMADNKAQLLITVNSIIISVLVSVLFSKLDEYPYLLVPAILLLTTNVSTMVFAILATRPKIPEGTFTKEAVEQKKVNLLFFGNFYKMNLDEYTWGMQQVMKDYEFLYGTLIRDVYAQGIVLGKKYKLLRNGYSVFMYGIIISVLAFIISMSINNAA